MVFIRFLNRVYNGVPHTYGSKLYYQIKEWFVFASNLVLPNEFDKKYKWKK